MTLSNFTARGVTFRVMGRLEVESLLPLLVPHIFLSIQTPGDPNAVALPTNAHTLGVLSLSFHDLPDMPSDVTEAVFADEPELRERLFTRAMGREVVEFVSRYVTEVKVIVAHCDAGLSRSPALATALAATVFDDMGVHPRGNSRVYRCVREAWLERPLRA